MNTVLSNYGQLCGCPEILKKSCNFFVVGLTYGCLSVWKWKPSNSGTFLAAVQQAVSTVAGSSRQPSSLRHTKEISISSFLCLITTYCMGLNVMYCFGNTAKRNDCCNTAENDFT